MEAFPGRERLLLQRGFPKSDPRAFKNALQLLGPLCYGSTPDLKEACLCLDSSDSYDLICTDSVHPKRIRVAVYTPLHCTILGVLLCVIEFLLIPSFP